MPSNRITTQYVVTADGSQVDREMRRLNATARRMAEQQRRLAQSFRRTGQQIRTFATVAAGIYAAARSVTAFVRAADGIENVRNRLRTVTTSADELSSSFDGLFQAAQRVRVPFNLLGNLYARIAVNTQQLGLSQRELTEVVEAIGKTVAISGSSADEARGALVQLSQGLAADAFRGQELNSVAEQIPFLFQTIARGLNVSLGELRKIAKEGGLTAAVVIGAIVKEYDVINERFGRINATTTQTFTTLTNTVGLFIDEVNRETGFGNWLTELIKDWAEDIPQVAEEIEGLINKLRTLSHTVTSTGVPDGGSGAVGGLAAAYNIHPYFGKAVELADRYANPFSPIDSALNLADASTDAIGGYYASAVRGHRGDLFKGQQDGGLDFASAPYYNPATGITAEMVEEARQEGGARHNRRMIDIVNKYGATYADQLPSAFSLDAQARELRLRLAEQTRVLNSDAFIDVTNLRALDEQISGYGVLGAAIGGAAAAGLRGARAAYGTYKFGRFAKSLPGKLANPNALDKQIRGAAGDAVIGGGLGGVAGSLGGFGVESVIDGIIGTQDPSGQYAAITDTLAQLQAIEFMQRELGNTSYLATTRANARRRTTPGLLGNTASYADASGASSGLIFGIPKEPESEKLRLRRHAAGANSRLRGVTNLSGPGMTANAELGDGVGGLNALVQGLVDEKQALLLMGPLTDENKQQLSMVEAKLKALRSTRMRLITEVKAKRMTQESASNFLDLVASGAEADQIAMIERQAELEEQRDRARQAAAERYSRLIAKQAEEVARANQQWKNVGLTIATDIVGGLRAGNSLVDVFGTAIDRVFARLLELHAINPLADLIGTSLLGVFGSPTYGGGGAAAFPLPIPGLASGGIVSHGGLAVVGERGPELVELPTGAEVFSTGTGPGRNVMVHNTINVNGVQDPTIVRNEVARMLPQITEASKNAVVNDLNKPSHIRRSVGGF